MAKRGVQEFLQSVVKQSGGISASNLYEWFIQPPGALGNWFEQHINKPNLSWQKSFGENNIYLQLLCNEIQLPGVTYAGVDVKMPYKGITQKMAGNKVFNELDVSFFLDGESTPLKVFRGWQDFIMGAGVNHSLGYDLGKKGYFEELGPYDRNIQQSFAQSYYNDYTCDIVLRKLEKHNLSDEDKHYDYRCAYEARLAKAYPYTVSSVPYSAGPAQVVKVSVGFYYEYSHLVWHKGTANNATIPDQKALDAIAYNKPFLVPNGVTQDDITKALQAERGLGLGANDLSGSMSNIG